jgi:integrase
MSISDFVTATQKRNSLSVLKLSRFLRMGGVVRRQGILQNLAKHFRSIIDLAGVPRLRLYDLRHSAATIALAAGVSPKVVSEQLGHASTAFTLDTYAHVLPHMQDEAAARVEATLFGATA